MKKLVMLMVLSCLSATAMAAIVIPQAQVYIPFENGDGRAVEKGYYAPGSGLANPAWNNVAPSTPEQVNYIGATGAATWAVTGNVDGLKGDYMDMTGMGTPGTSTFATLSYKFDTVTALSQAKSYTFTFWVNTKDAAREGSNTYIFRQHGATNATAKWLTDGRMLVFNGSTQLYSPYHAVKSLGDWVFCALSYDTLNGRIALYTGDESSSVILAKEWTGLTIAAIPTLTAADPTTTPFILGGYTYNATDKYPGMDMDEFRIFSNKTDASGALSMNDIEAIRQFDVPEPATIALLGLGLLSLRKRK